MLILRLLANHGGQIRSRFFFNRLYRENEEVFGGASQTEANWDGFRDKRWQQHTVEARNRLLDGGYIVRLYDEYAWKISDSGRGLLEAIEEDGQ